MRFYPEWMTTTKVQLYFHGITSGFEILFIDDGVVLSLLARAAIFITISPAFPILYDQRWTPYI